MKDKLKKKYDSQDEIIFTYWLNEALENDLILSWKRCNKGEDTIEIIPKKTFQKKIVLKTKVKWVERHLINSLTYTPDFIVTFRKGIMEDTFPHSEHINHNTCRAIIDVKSAMGNINGRNVTAVTFPIIRKVLYHLNGTYVHKIVLNKLFEKTWCPKEKYWMKNRKSPTKTKIGRKTMLIEEFLNKNGIEKVIDMRVAEVNCKLRGVDMFGKNKKKEE